MAKKKTTKKVTTTKKKTTSTKKKQVTKKKTTTKKVKSIKTTLPKEFKSPIFFPNFSKRYRKRKFHKFFR